MDNLAALVASPEAWAALVTLVVMEVVLGVDNLVFVSILSNKLPPETRGRARRLGIGMALILRLVLLSTLAFIVGLTKPVFTLPFAVPAGADGHPMIDLAFSWRDLILLAGGLFLVWKATTEIHHSVDPTPTDDLLDKKAPARLGFTAAIVQIIALDIVFSIDSILTAVGMTEHLPIMMVAVVIAVGLMMVAARGDDRGDPDRRRLRGARAQGLHLCGHGLLGPGGGAEHRRPQDRGEEDGRRPLGRQAPSQEAVGIDVDGDAHPAGKA